MDCSGGGKVWFGVVWVKYGVGWSGVSKVCCGVE